MSPGPVDHCHPRITARVGMQSVFGATRRMAPVAAVCSLFAVVPFMLKASEHLGATPDEFAFESAIGNGGNDVGDASATAGDDARQGNASAATARDDDANTTRAPQPPDPASGASGEARSPTIKRAGDRPPPVEPRDPARSAGAAVGAEDRENDTRRAADSGDFEYDSAYEDYRAYDSADGPGWIESNRRVGEVGGWRTYAREIYEAQKAEQAAAEDDDR